VIAEADKEIPKTPETQGQVWSDFADRRLKLIGTRDCFE